MSNTQNRAKTIGEILLKYKVIENLFGGGELLSLSSSNIASSLNACRFKFKDYQGACTGSHSITSVFSLKQKIARGDVDAIERSLEALSRYKDFSYPRVKDDIEKNICEIEKGKAEKNILHKFYMPHEISITIKDGKATFFNKEFVIEGKSFLANGLKTFIDGEEIQFYKKDLSVCDESAAIQEWLQVSSDCAQYKINCELSDAEKSYSQPKFHESGMHEQVSIDSPYSAEILNKYVLDDWMENLNNAFKKDVEDKCYNVMTDYGGIFAPDNTNDCMTLIEETRIEALKDVCYDQKLLVGDYTNPLCVELDVTA